MRLRAHSEALRSGAAEQSGKAEPDRARLHAGKVGTLYAHPVIISLHSVAMSRAELPTDRLWTQKEAAYFLGVSARYLRDSDCPKVLLPGNGAKGQPLVRYDPADVKAWAARWNTRRVA